MPKYPENLIHFCRPVLEHYELKDEMGRMFVRSMTKANIQKDAVKKDTEAQKLRMSRNMIKVRKQRDDLEVERNALDAQVVQLQLALQNWQNDATDMIY
eukprot:COSAG05_NODE_7746_length_773_cov_12.477745_1_plen_99_part_00